MTTVASTAPAPIPASTSSAPAHRRLDVTWPRVVRSEWIKFWSVRSTVWTLLGAAIAIPLIGMLMSAVASGDITGPGNGGASGSRLGGMSPLDLSLNGVAFAMLIVGVLGVLVGSREYATGQIRTTLQAVPHRLMALGGKAVVLGSVVFAAMLASAFVAFFGGQAILASSGAASVSITDAGSLQGVIGAAGYLAGVALIGLALGFLLRSTAGAIGTLVAGLMIVPGILALLLPDSWLGALDYLPSAAGDAMRGVSDLTSSLDGWTGLVVFVAWIVAAMAGAGFMLERRDA